MQLETIDKAIAVNKHPGRPYRLTILAPHLVQYHAPLYQALAKSPLIDLRVYYLDTTGAVAKVDASMGAELQWDSSLLEGYRSQFLRNWSPTAGRGAVLGRVNPSLFYHLLRDRADAVLIQGYQSVSNWIGLGLPHLKGIKVLFRGEATLSVSQNGTREKLKKFILRRVLTFCHGVFYTVPGNRDYYLHYGCPERKLYPLPCAVDNHFFRDQRVLHWPDRDSIRRKIGIPPNLPTAIMVGRMAGLKRQEHLIQAIAALSAEGISVGLLLIGDGPERAQLEEMVQRHSLPFVRFLSFLPPSEICKYYVASDFCVLCSEIDPSPKVLNEALNFSLPLITSDRVGQIGDSARDGENTVVYPYADIQALTNAVRSFATNEDLRTRFGQRSLDLSDDYSLETDVQCVENALSSICREQN